MPGDPRRQRVQPGTKAAAWYRFDSVAPGETMIIRLRLIAGNGHVDPFGATFHTAVQDRSSEADEYHDSIAPELDDERKQRAAHGRWPV